MAAITVGLVLVALATIMPVSWAMIGLTFLGVGILMIAPRKKTPPVTVALLGAILVSLIWTLPVGMGLALIDLAVVEIGREALYKNGNPFILILGLLVGLPTLVLGVFHPEYVLLIVGLLTMTIPIYLAYPEVREDWEYKFGSDFRKEGNDEVPRMS